MNTSLSSRHTLIAVAVAAVLLTACASAPVKPDGADALRARLTQLQSDPQLGTRAPLAMQQANLAVTAAEKPQADQALSTHLEFMADRKISIARAEAESQLAIDQRKGLAEQREAMRLQARTQEADAANRRANRAQASADDQRQMADAANSRAALAQANASDQAQQTDAANSRAALAQANASDQAQQTDAANSRAALAQANASDQAYQTDAANSRAAAAQANANDQERQADAARSSMAEARHEADELQHQIKDMQARVTDRGLVLTLGDVLFASGAANLNFSGNGHLDKLAVFLNKYSDRTVLIEGHTDSIGSEDYNLGLSQRRADSVRSYLVQQGISSSRLSAAGKGKGSPVADNSSATGRQQNRRVEVIIENTRVSER
jgi:outer membrane protein OmpA-like peptidoglycan-associated protein